MVSNQLSLAELNALIGKAIDDAFSQMCWIRTEISELTVNRSGHCYLELVDVDENTKEVIARGRATIWSYTFRMLKPYFETTTGQSFAEGIKVLVQAKVEYHPVYGLSLNIRDIDPVFTMGDMARKRREIIQQLEEDGVLTMNQELQLPLVPQRIAIISSPTAAGLQDFLDQLENHTHQVRFYPKLFPAVMQGNDSADSIMQALEQIFQYEDFFDVVTIIRGGGAQLDLASFDHYELAYHITQFPVPVLTGIGHDKDETVIDLVAHTSLKTPTAVAEFLISGALSFEQILLQLENRFIDLAEERLEKEKAFLQNAGQQLANGIRQLILKEEGAFSLRKLRLEKSIPVFIKQKETDFKHFHQQIERYGLNDLKQQSFILNQKISGLDFYTQRQFRIMKTKLSQIKQELKIRLEEGFKHQGNQLQNYEEKTRLMDPVQILKRGYSLTYSKHGKLIKSVAGLCEGDQLKTQLADGKIVSKIIKNEYGSKKTNVSGSSQ